jgi:uncharacterized protein YceK
MVRKRLWAGGLVLLALGLVGCGTVCNLVPVKGTPRTEVFGGAQLDAELFTSDVQGTTLERAAWPAFALLDLPLSLLGDAFTLPYTISATLWREAAADRVQPAPRLAPPETSTGQKE